MFKRRADEVVERLRQRWPTIEAVYNPEKPRRGAFELVLITEDGSEVLIWSGLKRGPPRKEKFPNLDLVQDLLNEALNN